MKTLDMLPRGLKGRIVDLAGEDDRVARLHSLGFLPGSEVCHQNTAPLGDPVAYLVGGQKISMRRRDASLVQIELIAA